MAVSQILFLGILQYFGSGVSTGRELWHLALTRLNYKKRLKRVRARDSEWPSHRVTECNKSRDVTFSTFSRDVWRFCSNWCTLTIIWVTCCLTLICQWLYLPTAGMPLSILFLCFGLLWYRSRRRLHDALSYVSGECNAMSHVQVNR